MLEAIAHEKSEKLIKRFSKIVSKIVSQGNRITVLLCFYKRFPLEWVIEQIDDFDQMLDEAMAIIEELNKRLVKVDLSSTVDKESEILLIGLELFLYIKQNYNLQELSCREKASGLLSEISSDSKTFLKYKRYGLLYYLQYGRVFEDWNTEGHKKHLKAEPYLFPQPAGERHKAIGLDKYTIDDCLKMSNEELFHIYDGGKYLEDLKDYYVEYLKKCRENHLKLEYIRRDRGMHFDLESALDDYNFSTSHIQQRVKYIDQNGRKFNSELFEYAIDELDGEWNGTKRNLKNDLEEMLVRLGISA